MEVSRRNSKALVYVFPLSQVLAQNSGYDPQETLVKLQAEYAESGQLVGVDLNSGETERETPMGEVTLLWEGLGPTLLLKAALKIRLGLVRELHKTAAFS